MSVFLWQLEVGTSKVKEVLGMLEHNKDRLIWAILAVVVAIAVGLVVRFGFPEIANMIMDYFRGIITGGFTM